MRKQDIQSKRSRAQALWLAGTLLAASGCTQEPAQAPTPTDPQTQVAAATQEGEEEFPEGKESPLSDLPFIEPLQATQVFAEQLKEPTGLEENVALHVKLPAPLNPELEDSLVRVLGEPERPLVLFRSDALEKLGKISKSPGPGFFTTFAQLSQEEVEARLKNEEVLASGKFGEPVHETVVFDGRRPVGLTKGIAFDRDLFNNFGPTPLSICPAMPASTQEAWDKSLLIRDPAVVGDLARTWDPCTGDGNPDGKWTFNYLITEMAQNSGRTPQEFVREWLETWVNNQTINGDDVAARTQMFHQVIQPWATASKISSAMVINPSTNRREVLLGNPGLDLKKAPFRLLAIVNRIDLGKSGPGFSGYGGPVTEQPTDAGELRFVFGVTQPNPWGAGSESTCGKKEFTVILEYGVPGRGCGHVTSWARDWAHLNTFSTFDSAYRAHLESLTERVVTRNKAPGKGNGSAINQIRTNENALDPTFGRWELREFTLSIEDYEAPPGTPDLAADGPLRMHTVAQTPNDGAHTFNSQIISDYILGDVLAGVPLSVGPLPANCSAAYEVPFKFQGQNFRGGNALVRQPTHWRAIDADASNAREVCARFQFSSNTCNGCHFSDSGTTRLTGNDPPPGGNLGFVHISPVSARPAKLSKFLTGGGTGFQFGVGDTQFGTSKVTWQFADLDHRFKRLYELSHCTQCSRIVVSSPGFIRQFVEIARVLPIDPVVRPEKPEFPIGPVKDLEVVGKLLEVRSGFAEDFRDEPVNFIRPAERRVH